MFQATAEEESSTKCCMVHGHQTENHGFASDTLHSSNLVRSCSQQLRTVFISVAKRMNLTRRPTWTPVLKKIIMPSTKDWIWLGMSISVLLYQHTMSLPRVTLTASVSCVTTVRKHLSITYFLLKIKSFAHWC